MKKIFWWIFAAVLIVVGGVWFFLDGTEAIEDTNGPDHFDLQTITDQMIIDQELGMVGGISVKEDLIGDGITISSKGFSGVYDVLFENYVLKSDFHLRLTALTVTEGNFKAVIVHGDEIVEELPFNAEDPFIDYYLWDVTGDVHLRIAGESAAFSFSMLQSDYEAFSHQ